jgi:DNA-directed RNA polymerase specialized sigma24 family protein
LIIVSSSRRREPTRIIGHPDLASGASVQRGETLYVSIAEAVYRESRNEPVELHFTPTPEDAEALSDLRSRARNRWENDRLPDGWTRPLPPPPTPKTITETASEEIQAAMEEWSERQRQRAAHDEH